MVRAVNKNGLTSGQPAVFEFRILRPIYLRWWFLALAALLTAGLIYLLYRYRVNQLLEIERTRTRIATDLHDDIGANLSKISLLSEIVKMRSGGTSAEDRGMLTTIAEVSRSSVDAMRDIVWAISPNKDSILEMTRKMREHAEEILVPHNVEVKFAAPTNGTRIKLSMDVRRELYLIFKEAINNAVRHSACSRVDIDLLSANGEVYMEIKDDGHGFDISEDFCGNGLGNMKARALKIDGSFEIESQNGNGTRIKIRIPT